MTWPLLADLELLVRSDQLGSLSAAARELGLSQPEASRRLSRLEGQLDQQLMVRSHTGSRLTKAGELVAEWSNQLLDQATQWQAGVAALHARTSTQLLLAASQTIAEYLAPRWLAAFRTLHEDVVARLEVHNSAHVAALVASGETELGLVESPSVPAMLESVSIGRDRLVVVVAPGHPWSKRRSIRIQDVAATSLVVREPGSGTRETLEQALEGLPCTPSALELPSNAAVLSAAAAGGGPAVVSALAARGAIADGRLLRVPLSGRPLERELRAVWRRDIPLGHLAEAFVAMLRTDEGMGR
ncbi:LysR family transcriptional regulator [Tessaracoccus antarcticus]|uniref:LysR family transcriptional regulator n=1 Tax=Tessaracoccus antarcticus TaxID=2479848 RepID=A0A3M0G539_9ACTN|nr:LysR family transcriptional regulator [Tessaracoccus antarcticus]RMB60140.1 LysR family transcriptional regulator [Tessaracoccus antarcticus]